METSKSKTYYLPNSRCRYIAGILPIRRKLLNNRSISPIERVYIYKYMYRIANYSENNSLDFPYARNMELLAFSCKFYTFKPGFA